MSFRLFGFDPRIFSRWIFRNKDAKDSSPNINRIIKSRRMSRAGHATRMGANRNAYGILVGKPEGKRPLTRPGHWWVDNNKIDLREIGWDDMDWIDLAQDRDHWRTLVNMVMNLRVP
jgi:hypothetical protein